MAPAGGDLLIEVLSDWGVEVVFGLPGVGINGMTVSLCWRLRGTIFTI